MSNLVINKVQYSDVTQVDIPRSDGTGDTSFYDTSNDTATASDVRAGKTVHTAAGEVHGTMNELNDVNAVITTKAQKVEVMNGHVNSVTVQIADVEQQKIVAENIKANVNLLGVQGKQTVVDTEIAENAATASDIALNKKAFVSGQQVLGTHVGVVVTQDAFTKVITIR